MTSQRVLYHTLDDPLNPKQLPGQYSDLHTLYPGRPMDSDDNYNRYAVKPDDPEAAHATFEDVKEKTSLYGQKLEQKARKEGTKNGGKMTVNAIADPSELIEDPELKHANMLNPDTTPLLMDPPQEGEGLVRRVVPKEERNIRENYISPPPSKETKSYLKWLLLIMVLIGLGSLVYVYVTRQIDPYIF